jgi:hypothetical protein
VVVPYMAVTAARVRDCGRRRISRRAAMVMVMARVVVHVHGHGPSRQITPWKIMWTCPKVFFCSSLRLA